MKNTIDPDDTDRMPSLEDVDDIDSPQKGKIQLLILLFCFMNHIFLLFDHSLIRLALHLNNYELLSV